MMVGRTVVGYGSNENRELRSSNGKPRKRGEGVHSLLEKRHCNDMSILNIATN
jgi:hypothetical protein